MSSILVASSSSNKTPMAPLSTPKRKESPNTPVATESPGNWTHPRLAEITRRKNATTFSDKNVRVIVYNVLALVAVMVLRSATWLQKHMLRYSESTRANIGWVGLAVQLIPLLNIGIALRPLFRAPDDLADVPLTPAQRKLLGLPPGSAPATPGSVYSTPPRYSRTPSFSGSVGSSKSFGGGGTSSPLSGKGVATGSSAQQAANRRLSGSPFSPTPGGHGGSPLLQKAVGAGGRKASFGSPVGQLGGAAGATTTGASLFADAQGGTPSPSGKRTSVALNNKWLYEKGRRSSGSAWVL